MKKLLLAVFLGLVVPFAAVSAEEKAPAFGVTMVDMMRYEAGLASVAVKPVEFLRIPFGKNDDQIGGHELDIGHRTEGVPFAFQGLKDGSVWILDSINGKLKHFAADGKLIEAVAWKNHAEARPPVIRDFAFGPKGGFYLLCATDGKVELIDEKGQASVEIEGLLDAWAVGADPKGNVLVKSPVLNSVLRFNPQGELIEQYEHPDLSVYTDLEGNPYGLRGDDENAVLVKAKTASPVAEIELAKFPLEVAKERKAHYVSRQILGIDAEQRIYVELIACDDDGIIHQNRIVKLSPTGKELGRIEFFSKPYMAPDLPRRATVMPDGRILSFLMDDKGWALITWQIPGK